MTTQNRQKLNFLSNNSFVKEKLQTFGQTYRETDKQGDSYIPHHHTNYLLHNSHWICKKSKNNKKGFKGSSTILKNIRLNIFYCKYYNKDDDKHKQQLGQTKLQ